VAITLDFPGEPGLVSVETLDEEPWESSSALARQALAGVLSERDGAWPRRSETALALWLNARWRAHEADAWNAPLRELTIAVDGEPAPFTTVVHGEHFASVGRARGFTITIAGTGRPADLALETLAK
jgi:hypothetical protein